jgi:hypothetical protein
MGRAWLRHNVEEVGHFERFLPALYGRMLAGHADMPHTTSSTWTTETAAPGGTL